MLPWGLRAASSDVLRPEDFAFLSLGGGALAEACYVKACLYLASQVALAIIKLMLEEPHLSYLT